MKSIFRLLIFSCLLALATPPLLADTLVIGGIPGTPGSSVSLPFEFVNTHQIVGLQFDLRLPDSQVQAGSAMAASATTNHLAESRSLAPGRMRIVVYSTTNQLLPDDLFLEVPLSLGNNSPVGGPTVTVTNVLLTDKNGNQFTPVLSFPKFDDWRRRFFTEEELDDPTIAGDDQDPDHDGASNIEEYLAGTSPKAYAPATYPKSTLINESNSRFVAVTWRQSPTVDDATVEVEASSNLVDWVKVTSGIAPTGIQDAISVEWQVKAAVVPGERKFLRLIFKRQ